MAFDPTSPADAAALIERQVRVRAWSLRIAGAVEAMPMPQSYRDGERAARAVTVADRMLARMPDRLPEPDADEAEAVWVTPARQRLRDYADDLFATVQDLPLPKTFLEGERAGRCALSMASLFEDVDQLTAVHARAAGFYPDGSVCDPAAPLDAARLAAPDEGRLMTQWLTAIADPAVPPDTG